MLALLESGSWVSLGGLLLVVLLAGLAVLTESGE